VILNILFLIQKVVNSLPARKAQDFVFIEGHIKAICKNLKDRENKFCYYVGGSKDAASSLLREISRPISQGLPVDKICERLKKMDDQVCSLRYEKKIDLNTVNLNTLRVGELKKILTDMGGRCLGCIEKSDFIAKIKQIQKASQFDEL